MKGFSTIADRISRPGRMRSAQTPATTEAEMGCTFPGTIEDEQLLPDEHGFGHHGAGPAGTDELGDRRNQM